MEEIVAEKIALIFLLRYSLAKAYSDRQGKKRLSPKEQLAVNFLLFVRRRYTYLDCQRIENVKQGEYNVLVLLQLVTKLWILATLT